MILDHLALPPVKLDREAASWVEPILASLHRPAGMVQPFHPASRGDSPGESMHIAVPRPGGVRRAPQDPLA